MWLRERDARERQEESKGLGLKERPPRAMKEGDSPKERKDPPEGRKTRVGILTLPEVPALLWASVSTRTDSFMCGQLC